MSWMRLTCEYGKYTRNISSWTIVWAKYWAKGVIFKSGSGWFGTTAFKFQKYVQVTSEEELLCYNTATSLAVVYRRVHAGSFLSLHSFTTLQPLCMVSHYTVTPSFLFKASFRVTSRYGYFSSGFSFYMCDALREWTYTSGRAKRRNKSAKPEGIISYKLRYALAYFSSSKHSVSLLAYFNLSKLDDSRSLSLISSLLAMARHQNV